MMMQTPIFLIESFLDRSIRLHECSEGTDGLVRPSAVTSSHTNQLPTESDRDGTGQGLREKAFGR